VDEGVPVIWVALAAAIALALGARSGQSESILLRWLNEWRKHLRRHVEDDKRRAAAEAILDDEYEHLDGYFVTVDCQMRALYDVHRDYAANFGDYVPYIDDMLATFGELQRHQVAVFLELHSTLTADEWSAIQQRIGNELHERQAKHET
jgi:hypothetical protein